MFPRWPLAPLLGGLLAAGCSSSTSYCPGLCPAESIHPTMTIEVEDGTASIASAEVVNGPCARLLIHSAGEAGVPIGYAAVQVTYNGSTSIAPLCLVEVTSLRGDTTAVTTNLTISHSEHPCCPAGSCCSETSAVSLHTSVTFTEAVHTVAFPAAPDGGPNEEDAAQTIEDGALDNASEIDAGLEIDAESVDAAEPVDAAAVDAAEDGMLIAIDLNA